MLEIGYRCKERKRAYWIRYKEENDSLFSPSEIEMVEKLPLELFHFYSNLG